MAAGVVFLLKQKSEAREVPNPAYDRFPSLGRLDELIFRYVVFGFITDTIMISAGAIWAKDLWGATGPGILSKPGLLYPGLSTGSPSICGLPSAGVKKSWPGWQLPL